MSRLEIRGEEFVTAGGKVAAAAGHLAARTGRIEDLVDPGVQGDEALRRL